MSKKKVSYEWILWSLVLVLIMGVVYLFVSKDSSFQVKYEAEHMRPGYETVPAWVTISASAAIKWAGVSAGWKLAGWIAMALIPICNFIAWKWDYKFASLGTPWLRLVLNFGPVLICAICWLASYSSRLDLGAYNQSFEKFKSDMQISDVLAEKIQKEGGSGNLLIKDENGLLTEWFKAQK